MSTPTQRRFMAAANRRAALLAPGLKRAYLDAIQAIVDLLPEVELAGMIANGTLDAALDALMPQVFDGMREQMHKSVAESFGYFAKDVGGPIAFNVLNPKILQALRTLDERVLKTLAESVRESVRAQVQAGLEAGVNPRTMARGIRQMMAMPKRLTDARDAFRWELEHGKRAALSRALGKGYMKGADGQWIANRYHAAGEGLTAKQVGRLKSVLGTDTKLARDEIDAMVAAYAKRLEAWNAETVARTLASQAQAEGQKLAWQAGIDAGWVDGDALFERWVTAHDDRVRPEHAAMDGEVVPFGQVWANGLRPGEDWNCRCVAIEFVDRKRAKERAGVPPAPTPVQAPPIEVPAPVVPEPSFTPGPFVPSDTLVAAQAEAARLGAPVVPGTTAEALEAMAESFAREGGVGGEPFDRALYVKNWRRNLGKGVAEVSGDERLFLQNAVNEAYASDRFRLATMRYGDVPHVPVVRSALGSTDPFIFYRTAAAQYQRGWVTHFMREDLASYEVGLGVAPEPGLATASGGNWAGIVRHEYGHHVQRMLWGGALRDEWLGALARVDEEGIKRGISWYAKKNEGEAFSELFSMVTDPLFDRTVFPAEIQPLIDIIEKVLR